MNEQCWPIGITTVKFVGNCSMVGSLANTDHISALWLPDLRSASGRLVSVCCTFSHLLPSFLCHPHDPYCICKSHHTIFKGQLKFPLLRGIISSSSSPESALPLVSYIIDNSWLCCRKPNSNWLEQQIEFISSCNQESQ